MNEKNFSDIRCILLCRSFQPSPNSYNALTAKLKEEINSSVQLFCTLGEYDGIFSFKLDEKEDMLKKLSEYNMLITKNMNESIFYKTLYLFFPSSGRTDVVTSNFWNNDAPFFFVSSVHTSHCCVGYDYKEKGREYIIQKISSAKMKYDLQLSYIVYYSLDLSEYIILWKTHEPLHVLKAMQYLYENEGNVIGYTNTISAIPHKCFSSDKKTLKLGSEAFSITIQAVAKSYAEVTRVHDRLLTAMKKIHKVKSIPQFSFGNYDYICTFYNVSAEAFFDLHKTILEDEDFRKSILSLNVTVANKGYDTSVEQLTNSNSGQLELFKNAHEVKERLKISCKKLKRDFLELFCENSDVFDRFHWRKPISNLLVLLDNMSKSTVFDSVCFLLFDSAHLFLSFLKHLKNVSKSNEELFYLLVSNGLHIEKFIREWEELAERVVRADGTFQRTPGYESLDYNVSACLVEYQNAYAQKLINYFVSLDSQEKPTQISSFVVPKMCRNFKTAQWFFDNREKDSMLFITIPMSQMKNPFFIMISLTHEISHYCPNSIRLREKRTKALSSCMAILICNQLNINHNNTMETCDSLIYEYLLKSLKSLSNDYLSEVCAHLKKATFALIDNTEKFQKLHETFFCDNPSASVMDKTQVALDMRRDATKLIGFPSDYFSNVSLNTNIYMKIEDIVSFFKEGYADIIMVYVLSLNIGDYLKAILADAHLLNLPQENGKLRMKFQRIIVVFEALIKSGVWSENYEIAPNFINKLELDIRQSELVQLFFDEYNQWKNDNIDEPYWSLYYPREVLLVIIDYLESCISEIQKVENNKEKFPMRKEIRKLYEDITYGGKNGLFSRDFQNTLQENRENILKRWENRNNFPFTFI